MHDEKENKKGIYVHSDGVELLLFTLGIHFSWAIAV